MFWKKKIDGHEGAEIQRNWVTGDYRLVDKNGNVTKIPDKIYKNHFVGEDFGIYDIQTGPNSTYLVNSKIYIKGNMYENKCSILNEYGGLIFRCINPSEFMVNKDAILISIGYNNTMKVDANTINFFKKYETPIDIYRKVFIPWYELDGDHTRIYTQEDILRQTRNKDEEEDEDEVGVDTKSQESQEKQEKQEKQEIQEIQEIQERIANNMSGINIGEYLESFKSTSKEGLQV